MKRKFTDNAPDTHGHRWKFSLALRITLFVFLANMFTMYASRSYSQENKVTVVTKNASIIEVLEQIRTSSKLNILYSADELDVNKSISVNFENASVEDVLNSVLEGQHVGYVMKGDKVIISKKRYVEPVRGQQDFVELKGKVTDVSGLSIPGVNVFIKGTTLGTITDIDGNYLLNIPASSKVVVFSFIGMNTVEVDYKGQKQINMVLTEDVKGLDEVVVVAFGKQKKESVIASIQTVDVDELKVPSSNLTTAMAGRISGIVSYQRSGEPGRDNAQYFIRGVTTFGYTASPLILIDGVESSSTTLARLQPDDIQSFSILKDAAAAALYGARGANGVIMVTTKEGKEGVTTISFRYENSFSSPTQDIDLADPITYMNLHNEAVRTRDPLGLLPYTEEKIKYTQQGVNPYVYPQTDWHKMLFKDVTNNQRFNLNISGGGSKARYYLALTANQDNGILNVDERNNFNNNIDYKHYNVRSNVNMSLTPTTEAALKFSGDFNDYTGPISGGTQIYKMAMAANPVLFPAYYPPDEANLYKSYILFGNYGEAKYVNPYAEMLRGYQDQSSSNVSFQFTVNQNLDFLTKGLRARILFNTTHYSNFALNRSYNPFYYNVASYDIVNDTYVLDPLNPESGTEYLDYSEGGKNVYKMNYFEAAVNYDRTYNEVHNVSGMLIFTRTERLNGNAGSLEKSLPYRNQGLSGRFTYSFNSRYFVEGNFGYNGSERFDEENRYGFFPSGGLGWILSNEDFWSGIKNTISKFKIKGTYGLVGNDAIGGANDRFFYLAQVDMNSGSGATFGLDMNYHQNGITMQRYPNPDITWETAYKMDVGFELSLWDAIDINADYFKERRTNILMDRLIPADAGLEAAVRANVGESFSEGVDMSVDANFYITNDWWASGRLNFTYATSEFIEREEPDYSETPWVSSIGQSLSQSWGFIAERMFIDEADVANSPTQSWGEYGAGDLKYRDINGDDKITNLDKVPIGYPTVPEIMYGAGLSTGYKGIDFSMFFQGSARSTFWVDPYATAPFINNGYVSGEGNNALLQAYADDHWSEDNRNVYAMWPRLDYRYNANNSQRSTWFMYDGSFLRLKSVEVGYSLPKELIGKIKMEKLRIYYSGINLASWSNFSLWDAEMGGNGMAYPLQRVHNIGVQLTF
jgi:TonB-linked SusC/RagA family outer membrane protein